MTQEQKLSASQPHQHADPDADQPVVTPDTVPVAVPRGIVARFVPALLALGGVLLVGYGQVLLLASESLTWQAGILLGVGMLLFGVAAGWQALFPSVDATVHWARSELARAWHYLTADRAWRGIALLVSVAATGGLLYVLQLTPPMQSYTWGLLVWSLAIGLVLAIFWSPAVLPPRDWLRKLQMPPHRTIWLALAGVLVVALGVRLWSLDSVPSTLGGDEGSQGVEAMRVLEGAVNNPFSTGWLGVPTLSFYFNSLSIAPLGNTIWALRLPWALVGTATVLVVFLLVWRLMGLSMAFATAALLAVYHYHIHFSRLGSNQIADALFVALALLFLYRGYDRRSPFDWALCGAVVGTAQYFYAGARLTAVLVIVLVAYFFVRDGGLRFVRERITELTALGLTTLVAAAPMLQYAFRFPDDYNARVNMVGIFQSGWLENEVAVRGEPMPLILWDQLQRAALAFNLYPDRTVWYGTPEPLLDPLSGGLMLLGLGYGVVNWYNRRIFPMVAWWVCAMLLGGMLTESPPSSQRLVTMAVPAVFLVALAAHRLLDVLLAVVPTLTLPRQLSPRGILVGALVIAFGVSSLRWYFVEYTPMYIYGSYNGVVATALGKQARAEFGRDWHMIMFGPPRLYLGFGSIPYLAPHVPGTDIPDPLSAPINEQYVLPDDKHLAFIFLPERYGELRYVQAAFPDGDLETVPAPMADATEPLYYLYTVENPAAVPAPPRSLPAP